MALKITQWDKESREQIAASKETGKWLSLAFKRHSVGQHLKFFYDIIHTHTTLTFTENFKAM